MSILERFSTIIKANINDLLDRAEDPAKMMDQYMRQLMSDLADVKRETASVIAEESRIQRQLEEKRQESAKNADLARRALQLSNEDDARVFLAKKQELEKRIEELQKMYDVAHENSMRMRQVHDKLVSDAETLRQRREAILTAEGEKQSRILVAEGHKESKILEAEAEKQAAILHAEAVKEAKIREAEGEAAAIEAVQKATADAIRLLNEANAGDAVIKLKALEAFSKAADGQATKIIIPSEIQGLAGLAEGVVSAVQK